MKKFLENKKGFTLVELLVVIAIIAILAAVVAPNAFKAIEKSKITAIEADYRAIKTATLVYYSDTGIWPETKTNKFGFIKGTKINGKTKINNGWSGPYLDVWPAKSPLGTGYEFINASTDASTTDPITEVVSGLTPTGFPVEAIYLRIKDLPKSAYDRLRADLGEGQVFSDAPTATTSKTSNVYLLIATK